ncbi:hypothetical protein DV736_g1798, partial [Chaetothyriales sp. CBS 134916]
MTATNPADLRRLADEVQAIAHVYADSNTIENGQALRTSIRKLRIASAMPTEILFDFRMQPIENIAISVLLQSGVLDAIMASKGEVVEAQEIASATGYDEHFIIRFMRVATALLFCEEVDEAAYRPNQFTELLVQPGWKSGLRFAEITYLIGSNIRCLLRETSYGTLNGINAPKAFDFAYGMPFFKHLEADPELRSDFNLWMQERRRNQETLWHLRYPPGANGSQLIAFHQQFPNLPGRCILQDISMPESNRIAAEVEGLEAMQYDMFTPQPIKGARYYYFRNVFHNWDDENMKKALANLVPAMEPDYSRLLIDDYVLPRRNVQGSGAVEDILMMVYLGALERTTSQYEKLLHGAGLDIVSIVKVGINEEAFIEARVAPQGSTTK